MKPTQFFSLLLITFFFASCTPSRKISKKTINQDYHNLTFLPEQIQKLGLGKVEVTITPIDAASLDQETSEAANRDGGYEKEIVTGIEKIKSESESQSKAEKAYYNGVINGIEAINKLVQQNIIPSNTAYQLKLRILNGEDSGRNGTELTSLSDSENFSNYYNPYKINENYLSVFKITFENKGNEIEKIGLKELQVVSGEELLYPLGMEYFESNLKQETEKIKNAYRMNMPQELVLTPSQRITKFIAIPAINRKNENIQVQIIKGKEIVNFDFKIKEKRIRKDYLVESYDIFPSGFGDVNTQYFYYAVTYQDGVSFATSGDRIFVSEEKKKIPASIYVVSINRTSSRARTAKKVNFKFNEQEKNKVTVEYESMNKKKK